MPGNSLQGPEFPTQPDPQQHQPNLHGHRQLRQEGHHQHQLRLRGF